MLSKEQILQAEDRPIEKLDIPEWGGSINIRTMSAREKDRFEASCFNDGVRDMDNLRARLAVLVIVDDDGNRIFSDSDAAELGKKSPTALDKIFEAAQRLNAMTTDDIEELAKN